MIYIYIYIYIYKIYTASGSFEVSSETYMSQTAEQKRGSFKLPSGMGLPAGIYPSNFDIH